MDAVLIHPRNARVVGALTRKCTGHPTLLPADGVIDPYQRCGSHPGIVERVWDQLGSGLPKEARWILCGTPVLVDPTTGMILAVCNGTSYCLRLSANDAPDAIKAGCRSSHRWSDGTMTNIVEEFGPDWLFGCWAASESQWCRDAVANPE